MFDLQSSKLNVPCPSRAFTISTFRGWWHFRTQLSFFIISWTDHIFLFFTFTQLYFQKCQICIFLFTVNIAAISDVPVCATSEPVIYGVSKNERVDIVCRVASNPAEVQFRWTFNNSAELIRWVVGGHQQYQHTADLGSQHNFAGYNTRRRHLLALSHLRILNLLKH